MQLKSRILHFFLVLLMACFGVVSLVLLELFVHETPDAPIHLPQQAEWAMRVDLEQLVKDEAYTLLFRAKDDQLIATLRKIAGERVEKHSKEGPLTIDFRQDIVVFGMQENAVQLTGILLQVIDPELFRANIGKHLGKGQSAAVAGNTAVILLPMHHLPQKQLQQLAEACLGKTRKWEAPAIPLSETGHAFLAFETTSFGGKNGGMLSVNVIEEDHAIRLTGSFEPALQPEPARYSLKSTGLYISTSIIPEGMADSLNRLLPVGSFRLPELRAFTADYQGLSIITSGMSAAGVPHLNLVLESTQLFPVDSILRSVPADIRGPHNSIRVGDQVYYVKQLDERSVFIGLDTNAVIRKVSNVLCEVHGSLKALNKIEASPQALGAVNFLFPQLRFARAYFGKTETINFAIRHRKGTAYAVEGSLLFREDAYALHETVKLLLGLGLID